MRGSRPKIKSSTCNATRSAKRAARAFTKRSGQALAISELRLSVPSAPSKAGDVLVVWKLDRLGRSLQDLITILDQVNSRGAGFASLSDGIDTTTPAGKLLFHVTGAMAEF